MKVVAFVPIRLNSQRVEGKNLRLLGGEPLLCHILRTLLEVEAIDEVYVYCSDPAVRPYLPDGVQFLRRSPRLDRNETLGRVFNLLGRAIDNKPQPVTCEKWSIHRDPPAYDEQQNMIETDLHANKYDAMIIAPLQGDMASTLVSGTDMPIFAIDTDFNAPEKISFIGIGQKDAAASGGEKAVEAAKAAGWDKIEAAYIAGVQGDSTADARRTGFQEGIDGAGGTFLADEVQYADAVADKATVCMEGIMQSHPEGLAIIACHNDDCAIAAARAAANNPAYAKTIFIGFDGNITAAQSILDGGETMTVAQSGYDQGYQAVKTVVAHLNGEKVDSFVDCGTKVIDSTTAEDYMATLKSQMDGKAVAQ